jgi:MFS family permease
VSAAPADPTARPTAAGVTVLAALCLVALLAYAQRSHLGIVAQPVAADLGLSDAQMGRALGLFFLSYAVLQVPAGWLADVWGVRRTLAVMLGLGALATAVCGLAGDLTMLLTARLAMGAAQAGTFPCAVKAIGEWLPPGWRGFASGALACAMSAGTVLMGPLAVWLLGPVGWRGTCQLLAAPGLLAALAFAVFYRDRAAGGAASNGGLAVLPALALSPPMWWIGGQQFFRAAGNIFFMTWFTTYLVHTRGVTLQSAGWLTALPVLGMALGALAGGGLSDLILAATGRRGLARRGFAVVSLLASGAVIAGSAGIADATAAVAALSVGAFVSALAGPCAYAVSIDMGGRQTGLVFSTMNMAGNVGAFVFPLAVNAAVDSTGGWQAALWLFCGSYLAGAVCWLFLDTRGSVLDQSWRRPVGEST